MGLHDLRDPRRARRERRADQRQSSRCAPPAQDYQPFPSGVRGALPIDVSETVPEDESYVVDSALTDVGLILLEAAERSADFR